jgi:hypothetical protein
MRRFFILLLASAVLYPAVTSAPAEARRGLYGYSGGIYYYGEYRSKKPVHGYSGWHPGPYRLYCDYDRIPVRKCFRNGRCKVVEWIIRPYCY